jgi:hypothetical protein
MGDAATPSPQDLLKHFDDETRDRLARALNSRAITVEHLQELVRLTAASPRYRDEEELESLLEDAEDMAPDAFRAWVDQLLKDEKDG